MKSRALCLLAFSWISLAGTARASETQANYASAEAFGSGAFQSISPGGNSFAGGAFYTPSLNINSNWAVKGFVGPELFKSSDQTGSKIYVVADVFAALQWQPSDSSFAFNVGGGGGKDFRSSGVTRGGILAGTEYKFQKQFLGVFDRAILDGFYYLNSAKLYVIHYGLGINF